MRRINVSLDSRDPDRFRHITRQGDVAQVLGGIAAARDAGLRVKINMVALEGPERGRDRADARAGAATRGIDLTLIETMPLGRDRRGPHRSLPAADRGVRRARPRASRSSATRTAPAARRATGASTERGTRLGLISPLTANFCDGCNRVRLTTEGQLYLCLGHDDQVDLKAALRDGGVAGARRRDRRGDARPSRSAHDFRIEPARGARGRAPHERHRRMTRYERRALVASPTAAGAGRGAPSCADAYEWVPIERGRRWSSRSAATASCSRRSTRCSIAASRIRAGVRDEPRHRRLPDERMAPPRPRRPARARQAVQGHAAAHERDDGRRRDASRCPRSTRSRCCAKRARPPSSK